MACVDQAPGDGTVHHVVKPVCMLRAEAHPNVLNVEPESSNCNGSTTLEINDKGGLRYLQHGLVVLNRLDLGPMQWDSGFLPIPRNRMGVVGNDDLLLVSRRDFRKCR